MKLNRFVEYRYWSEDAKMCLNRQCICEGCQHEKLMSGKCMMKCAVLTLIKKFGPPSDYKEKSFIDNENEIEGT